MKTRHDAPNKDLGVSSYRPFVELDCQLCTFLSAIPSPLEDPLVVVDVGAARGFHPRWDVFGTHCIQVGFEPDPDECRVLQGRYEGDPTKVLLPLALAEREGKRTLYVPKDRDSTSLFKPYTPFFSRLPDPTLNVVEAKIEGVPVSTLDRCEIPPRNEIDVLKLDVEGAELLILQGGERRVRNEVLCVIAEVSLMRRYYDQPMFAEVDTYLRSMGFQLFDMDCRRWRRRKLPSSFDGIQIGQMVYGDVLYLKDPIESPELWASRDNLRQKLIKLVALAEFFGLPDYSLELLEYAQGRGALTANECKEMQGLVTANHIIRVRDRSAQ